jgi:hypothetical protein
MELTRRSIPQHPPVDPSVLGRVEETYDFVWPKGAMLLPLNKWDIANAPLLKAVGAPETWTGTFDAVRAALQVRIAELDATVNRVEEFGVRGATDLQLILATDDPNAWVVQGIRAGAYDGTTAWLDMDPLNGTSDAFVTKRTVVTGLPESARAVVDGTSSVEVSGGTAQWTATGHAYLPRSLKAPTPPPPSGGGAALP